MNDIAVIKLTGKRGGFTIVDADLFPKLNRHKWYLPSHGYVCREVHIPKTRKHRRIYLHRVVNQTPDGWHTDHINGCPIDNTRRNLRSCKHQQNMLNNPRHCDGSSRYKGVSWDNVNKKWIARIYYKSKSYFLGRFDSEFSAARAYNEKAVELFGEFAHLNLL